MFGGLFLLSISSWRRTGLIRVAVYSGMISNTYAPLVTTTTAASIITVVAVIIAVVIPSSNSPLKVHCKANL